MAIQSIEFQFTKNGYIFKDAIVLEDNHGMSVEQIETMKQARFDDWYAIVTAPTVED